MGVTVELESDELWCKSAEDAARAAELVKADDWIYPYHVEVSPVRCASGERQGQWYLEIEQFRGDHWHDDEAREVWLKIAPHMADGATIEFQGEGRERWRIRWQDSSVFEEYVAEVVWAVNEEISADSSQGAS